MLNPERDWLENGLAWRQPERDMISEMTRPIIAVHCNADGATFINGQRIEAYWQWASAHGKCAGGWTFCVA